MATNRLLLAFIPVSLAALATANPHYSRVPEDPFAFPKYKVTFLNGLPVLNETAQRWFQDGLRGGELEFLDQPWQDGQWRNTPVQGIEGGAEQVLSKPDTSHNTLRLEYMKMGPKDSYICLIPPPPEDSAPSEDPEPSTDVTPVHTWSLLQPLTGTCLYHRQGWFTYAYCHNSHVRQFHEVANPQYQQPGEYRPEEDTEWEAYTLGRAPPTLDPGADLTVAEEAALAANVELARGPGSRYLVQRWGDGTYCDKTGKKREVEVQFHCSMTMTDTILFVKETQTCRYVIHIATPRLCGEPGFRSRLDAREEAQIRCREIMDEEAYQTADRSLPTADRPLKMPRKAKPGIVAPPPASRKEKDMNQGNQAQSTAKKTQQDLIRKALERLLETGGLTSGEVIIESLDGDDGVIVEYIETDLELDPEETPTTQDESLGADPGSRRGDANRGKSPSLEDVLRAAGYGIKGEKARAGNGRSTRGGEEDASNSKTAQRKSDDEEEDSVRRRRKSGRDEL